MGSRMENYTRPCAVFLLFFSAFCLFLTLNELLILRGLGIVKVVKGIEGQWVLVQASCFSFLAV